MPHRTTDNTLPTPTGAYVGFDDSVVSQVVVGDQYSDDGAIDSHEPGYTPVGSGCSTGSAALAWSWTGVLSNAQQRSAMFNDVSQRDCDPHRTCRVQRCIPCASHPSLSGRYPRLAAGSGTGTSMGTVFTLHFAGPRSVVEVPGTSSHGPLTRHRVPIMYTPLPIHTSVHLLPIPKALLYIS